MNTQFIRIGVFSTLVLVPILFASPASAERNTSVAAAMYGNTNEVRFDIDEYRGFERKRFGSIRVRGWQISNRVYFGQARIADEWGLGFVFEDGDTVYGFNNRGIEVTRYF